MLIFNETCLAGIIIAELQLEHQPRFQIWYFQFHFQYNLRRKKFRKIIKLLNVFFMTMQFSRACKNEHKYKRRLFCAGKSYSRITNSYEAETLWNSNNSEQIKKKDFELKGSHRLAKRSSIIQSLFVQLGRGLLTNPAVDITTGLQNKKKQKKKKAREKVNCSLLKAVNLQP